MMIIWGNIHLPGKFEIMVIVYCVFFMIRIKIFFSAIQVSSGVEQRATKVNFLKE